MAVHATRVLARRCCWSTRRQSARAPLSPSGGCLLWRQAHDAKSINLPSRSRCLATAVARNTLRDRSSGRKPTLPLACLDQRRDLLLPQLLMSRNTLTSSSTDHSCGDKKTSDNAPSSAVVLTSRGDDVDSARRRGTATKGRSSTSARGGSGGGGGGGGARAARRGSARAGCGFSSSSRSTGREGGVVDRESSRVWTVPNLITMARICSCPALAGLIVTSQHELALAGLLAASVTDWLDGYIARKWNQKSVLGGFLDPLADKIMVTTVAIALGYEGIIPPALVALMVGRDALLIVGSLAHRYATRRPEDAFFDFETIDYKVTPSTLSKVNTALQFGTLWLGLTNSVYLVPGDAVFSSLCFVTGTATLASGANYLLVSGLKPKGKLGRRLMVQRENLKERYLEGEVLMRERMRQRRERLGARQSEFNDRLRARRKAVAGVLKDRISRGRQSATATGEGVTHRFRRGRTTVQAMVARHNDRARDRVASRARSGVKRGTGRNV